MVAHILPRFARIAFLPLLAACLQAQTVTPRVRIVPPADGSFKGIIFDEGSASISIPSSVLTISGSSSVNGNIFLIPGNVATHSSVYVLGARLDEPTFAIRDAPGTTASDAFELQTNAGTVYFKIFGGTDAGAPGTVVTKDIVPFLDATYKLGNTTHHYEAHLQDVWIAGTSIRPTTTGGANLGSSPLHFATAWINDISGSTATFSSTLTTANVFPSANLTYNLGAAGNGYASIFSQKVTFPNAGGDVVLDNPGGAQLSMTGGGLKISGTDTNNVPTLTLTNTTGGTGVAWKWASKNDGSVSLDGGGTIRQEFDPANTDWIFRANLVRATTQTLGTSSKRWAKLWVTDVDISGTCTGCLSGLDTLSILTDGSTPSTGAVRVYGEQAKETFHADTYGTGADSGFFCTRSRGTVASPSATQSGDELCSLDAGGYGTSLVSSKGRITFSAEGTWSGSSNPTRILISTTDTGSTTASQRWSVEAGGDILPLADNAYRIGYTTSQVSEFYNVNQSTSGTLTFTNGSGNVTLANTTGSLTVTGGIHFANEINADNGITVANGKSYHCVGACNLGASGQHVATAWIDAIVYNGSTGGSSTITVKNSAGSNCTITFSVGGFISSTC